MRTVVIGGGIAGLYAAKKLGATLVTKNKHFTFLPLLTDVLDGNDDCIIPITYEKTIFDEVVKIDQEKQLVHTKKQQIPYDELIIATGAEAILPVPGAKTYAKSFYTAQDAKGIREILPKDRIVIVGGGPTGVEAAMKLAKHGHVTILQGNKVILPTFSKHCQKYACKQLEKQKVTIRTGTRVQSITSKHIKADMNIPYDIVIWTAGVKASTPSGVQKDKGIPVNEFLQHKNNIWAIGDCAQSGSPLTAQAALQEAKHAVKNIKRNRKNKPLKPFSYKKKGNMVELGTSAHVQAGPFHLTGPLATLFRRLYYAYTIKLYQ